MPTSWFELRKSEVAFVNVKFLQTIFDVEYTFFGIFSKHQFTSLWLKHTLAMVNLSNEC